MHCGAFPIFSQVPERHFACSPLAPMLYDLAVAATDARFAIAECWKTGCRFENVDDIRALDHHDKDAIRECGITKSYTTGKGVSHRRSTQAWALTRNNSLTVTIRLQTGGRRLGRTRPRAIETKIDATSISRHFCYWLIFDSDILRRAAPSVDEHHYSEWKDEEICLTCPRRGDNR